MARQKATLDTAGGEELQGSLSLTSPKTQQQVVNKLRSLPEGKFQLYYWRFTTDKRSPAVLRNRAAAEKSPQTRTVADYIVYQEVAIRCKDYIGDAFGLNPVPPEVIARMTTKPLYNSMADGDTAKSEGRGFVAEDRLLGPGIGAPSYGIIFKGQISQPRLDGAPGAEPIKGNVVRVRVPSIVKAYHMLDALRNTANFSAPTSAIVGVVLPGGRRIQFGDLDQAQIDG